MTGAATAYRRGRTFEYQVRDALRKRGWVVMRSPQSRSAVDLIAMRPGRLAFFQCKVSGELSRAARRQLEDDATKAGAVPYVIDRPTRGVWRLRRVFASGFVPLRWIDFFGEDTT